MSNPVCFRLIAAGLVVLFASYPVRAGGPLAVGGPTFGVEGQPFTWDTTSAVQYNTDNGPLSGQMGDDEASARARVATLFQVWQNVSTAKISYNRAGFIAAVTGFSGGDVNTGAELTALENDCLSDPTPQSFIVYDANGQIFDDLGVDTLSVIGFAGPCALNSAGRIVGGEAVLNGLFTDGVTNTGAAIPNPADISDAQFDAAFIHEFGHFSGLDHSQINVNCLAACSADDLVGVPTMFPILVSLQMSTPSDDDIAWLSRLYPETANNPPSQVPFISTHGTITGTVFFTDTESMAQGVNVIARRVSDGNAGNGDETRRNAVSVVSGFKFTGNPGQSVTAGYLNGVDDNVGGSDFGSRQPGDIGLYEIPVPAGSYRVSVESIHICDPSDPTDFCFNMGSSVGPLSEPIPMPGTAPTPLGPIAITANTTDSGNDIVLIGTDPRFDQFEGP